jgi:hypothetical protein
MRKIEPARLTPGARAAPGGNVLYPPAPRDDGHVADLFAAAQEPDRR